MWTHLKVSLFEVVFSKRLHHNGSHLQDLGSLQPGTDENDSSENCFSEIQHETIDTANAHENDSSEHLK